MTQGLILSWFLRVCAELEDRLLWWDGLSFVQRRTAKNKDVMVRLQLAIPIAPSWVTSACCADVCFAAALTLQVRVTEKHFMAERDMFYHPGETFSKGGPGGGDGGGDGDGDGEKKSKGKKRD